MTINSNDVIDPMSFELNYSRLTSNVEKDKGMIELDYPEDNVQDYGYYSESVSDSNRLFKKRPKITFDFAEKINSFGITLQFVKRFLPDKFTVYWFYNNSQVYKKTYQIPNDEYDNISIDKDAFIYFCEDKVIGYDKLEIEFISTKYPNSRIKLNRIKFGKLHTFRQDDIVNAEIFEETDILSNRLTIDTLNFSIHGDKKDLNIFDKNSLFEFIRPNQKVFVYEDITTNTYNPYDKDNIITSTTERKIIGKYFIESFESKNSTELSIKCVDLIGLLEKSKFDLSENYYGATFEYIVNNIMKQAGIINDNYDKYYEIDDDLNNKLMFGFLPICSCREALHQVLFGAGAYAYSSREDLLKMSFRKPLSEINIYSIDDKNHIDNDSISKEKFVSGVRVKHGELICNEDDYKTILEGIYDRGTHYAVINDYIWKTSSEPYIEQEEYGEIIEDEETDKYIHIIPFNVYQDNSKITIKGRNMEYVTSFYQEEVPEDNKESDNIINLDNCYFINEYSDNVRTITSELLDYYTVRGKAKVEIIINDEKSGDWIYIKNIYGEICRANILNMKIDLANGFLATAELRYYEELGRYTSEYYCDSVNTEMYADNDYISTII